MTEQHPITPPAELVAEWVETWHSTANLPDCRYEYIATQAARWGYQQCMKLDAAWLEAKLQKARDQELEACCEWLGPRIGFAIVAGLRDDRRPKPPSLKEQALFAIDTAVADGRLSPDVSNVVRRALEQLDD